KDAHRRQGKLTEFFDAPAQSAINKNDVEDHHNDPKERADVEDTVRVRAGCVAKKLPGCLDLLCDRPAELDAANEIIPRIFEAPRFNINVVHVNNHRDQNREHTEIAGDSTTADNTEDGRSAMKSFCPSVSRHRPLCPTNRQREKQ